MKKKKFLKKSIAFTLAMLMLFGLFSLSVSAAPDGSDDGSSAVDGAGEVDPGSDTGGDPAPDDGSGEGGASDDPAPSDPTDGEEPTAEEPTQAEDTEPTEDADEPQSDYTEPPYLDELPEANDAEVVPATAVTIPPATVSDASLLSGIVMWLCVAVGIAVVVGVLVSKRTRRRGQ